MTVNGGRSASAEANATAATSPGRLSLERTERGLVLAVSGHWTLPHFAALRRAVDQLKQEPPPAALDFAGLADLDTAGAALLAALLGRERLRALSTTAPGLSGERRALLLAVGEAPTETAARPARRENTIIELLARIGRAMETVWRQIVTLLGFMGLVLATLLRTLPRPRRWRLTSLVSQIEQTGLNAVPIVALLTFMVGAVVAFLGATVLNNFGASIYTVDLVAYSFMREFGVLLTAIMLAGRTASAFTAQLGSMKANQELDALRVQGLDPIEMLVLPRILALMITLPMLTFLAVLCGLIGGGAVAVLSLDIPTTRFFDIVSEVPLRHYLVGLSKAPFFAFLIGLIGCLEGFKAGASAESVGNHTTSSVVQSIFVVILLDALAAMFFMEMGW